MPITKSAQKALRQSIRRRTQNLSRKEAYKTAIRTYKNRIAEKKFEDAKNALRNVAQALDKAVKTGVIHKNKASRLKSQFAKHIAKLAK